MIKVSELSYTYAESRTPAVRKVSFSIAEGEIFGFLGPSGAGKSTTQKILIKLLGGYRGDIQLLGRSLRDWGEDFYNHVGVGFELPNHYQKLTALENLQFFGAFYDRPLRPAMALLAGVGLEADANKRVAEYSKGMKMRLNFVRALQHDPEILFFDEPTSGLDPVNGRKLKDIILAEKERGKTIFLTTHKMQDAEELCDRVAFIVNGEITLIDSPQTLKLRYGKRKVRVGYHDGQPQIREFDIDGLGHNAEFLRILREENLQTLHTEEATLEDIFIRVTGEALE